jgi:hypothetical protein
METSSFIDDPFYHTGKCTFANARLGSMSRDTGRIGRIAHWVPNVKWCCQWTVQRGGRGRIIDIALAIQLLDLKDITHLTN